MTVPDLAANLLLYLRLDITPVELRANAPNLHCTTRLFEGGRTNVMLLNRYRKRIWEAESDTKIKLSNVMAPMELSEPKASPSPTKGLVGDYYERERVRCCVHNIGERAQAPISFPSVTSVTSGMPEVQQAYANEATRNEKYADGSRESASETVSQCEVKHECLLTDLCSSELLLMM